MKLLKIFYTLAFPKDYVYFKILNIFIYTSKTTFSPQSGKATSYFIKEGNWNRTWDPDTSGKKCTCILLPVIQAAYCYNPGCLWNWLLLQISNFTQQTPNVIKNALMVHCINIQMHKPEPFLHLTKLDFWRKIIKKGKNPEGLPSSFRRMLTWCSQ